MYRIFRLYLCTLRYKIMKLLVTSQQSGKDESALWTGEELDLDRELVQELAWLEREVRLVPYWLQGILRVANLRLLLRDFRGCYDACQVALLLEKTEREKRLAREVLSALYLRLGEFGKVRELLTVHCQDSNGSGVERELLVAALLGLGEHEEASRLVDSFSTSVVGGRTGSLHEYLRQRAEL